MGLTGFFDEVGLVIGQIDQCGWCCWQLRLLKFKKWKFKKKTNGKNSNLFFVNIVFQNSGFCNTYIYYGYVILIYHFP